MAEVASAEHSAMEATLGAGYSSDFVRKGETLYSDNAMLFDDPAAEDRLVAGGFLGEHEAFIAAVRSGQQPDCNLQDAQHSVRLTVAVHEGYTGPLADFEPNAGNPYR